MRFRYALAAVAFTVLQTFAAQQPAQPQPERPFGRGIIEVQVTRIGTKEGILDVLVTLQGPTVTATAEQLGQLFTPSSSLTSAQRDQINQLIQSGFTSNVPAETIANAANRMQAQLLGQPAPTPTAQTNPVAPAMRVPADITLTTDSDGRVSFPSLPPGRYTIRAQREGYFGPLTAGAIQPSSQVSDQVTLKETDEAPAKLAFTMMAGVVLAGRVRDPEGRPVTGSMIGVQLPIFQNGTTMLNTLNQAQTDDRGIFRIFGLPPGDYYVSAQPRRAGVAPSPQDTWATTFFPGVVDVRLAAPVRASEGGEVNGIDFAMQAVAVGRISGRIINPFKGADGKPTNTSQTLYLIPQGPTGMTSDMATMNFQNVAQERSNGEFEIRSIVPGLYDLMASAPTGGASTGTTTAFNTFLSSSLATSAVTTAWGRVRVEVGKEPLTNVTIPIKAGLEVKVRVEMDGAPPPFTMAAPPQRGGIDAGVVNALVARGVPQNEAIAATRGAASAGLPAQIPTPRVRLSLQSKDNSPVGNAASQANFDPSGLYVFPNVPAGSYRVQVAQLPVPEAYVADIRLGGVSIYDDGMIVDGPLPGDIEVAIVSKGGRIQGMVLNIENRPAANALVAFIPAEARRRGNMALYKQARANATGNFTINGVAPGIYKLFAWEDAPNNAWMNPDFLARYEELGQTVTISGGEPLNTNVRLIPKNYGR